MNEIPAKCEATGVKGHYHCSDCQKNFDIDKNEIDDLTIPEKGHEYGTWTEEISKTCTTDGVKGYYHCSNCQKYFDIDKKEIEDLTIKASHDFVEGVCQDCGQPVYSEGLAFTLQDDDTYAVSKGTFNEATLIIPSTYNGKNVTLISEDAFKDCDFITSATIGSNVSIIGQQAFYNCSSLETIYISKSVKTFRNNVFLDCSSLKVYYDGSIDEWTTISFFNEYSNPIRNGKLYISEELVKKVEISSKYISSNAFYKYTELTEVTITDEVGAILSYVFFGCTSLTKVTIENGVGQISEKAFADCTSLTSITVPTSVTNISQGVFAGCSSLEEITLPFVGHKSNIASDEKYIYPFGYVFGTTSYSGGVQTKQPYYDYYKTDTHKYDITTCDYYYVPATLKRVTITGGEIPLGAFYNCTYVTDIVLPDGLTDISDYAFCYCRSLDNIIIPDNVSAVGQYAFADCHSLTKINVPDKVTSISEYTFSKCYKLNNVSIPANVTSIGSCAFEKCYSLEQITLSTKLKTIGNASFSNCTSLISVTIPENVTSISGQAFSGCEKIVEVINKSSLTVSESETLGCLTNYALYIHNGSTKIVDYKDFKFITYDGVNYLMAYSGNETEITLPDDYNGEKYQVYKYAFNCKTKLTKVTIPDSISLIDKYAFSNCSSLKYNEYDGVYYLGNDNNPYLWLIYMPNGLSSCTVNPKTKYVISYAFNNNPTLTKITIPESVIYIGFRAFDGCSSLEEITIPFVGEKAGKTSSDTYQYPLGFIFSDYLYGGTKTEQNYYGNSTNKTTSLVSYLPSTLKKVTVTGGYVPYGAFYNCENITTIVLNNSVTGIGENAIYGCSSLEYNSDYYGNYLGNDNNPYLLLVKVKNTSYKSYTISTKTKYIYQEAFKGCSKLTSITVPDSVVSIGINAFAGCSALTEMTIPFIGAEANKTSTDTYQYPFGYLFGTSPYLGGTSQATNGVATEQCYYGGDTTKTTSSTYYVPNDLTKVTVTGGNILYGAFYNCAKITTVVLPDNLNGIGGYAFYNCSKLSSIEIPDSVTEIGSLAFYKCSALTEITVPEKVTTINSAFGYCSQLVTITIPESITSFGSNDFYQCKSLKNIYYTGELDSWTQISGLNNLLVWGDTCKNLYINGSLLTEVVISKNTCNNVFQYTGIKNVVISDGVTSISDYVFVGCSLLSSVTIPDSVTEIGAGAFYGCTSLTSVTIPEHVTTIGEEAFYGCSGLTSIIIPDSVTEIGANAFAGCSTSIYNEYNNAYYLGNDNNPYRWLIGAKDTSIASCTIHSDTKYVYRNAFYNCSSLRSITVGNKVEVIGDNAFKGCTILSSVTFGDSILSIGKNVLSGCSNLMEITIPFVGDVAGKTSSDANQYPFGYLFGTTAYTSGVATKQQYYESETSITSSTYYIPTYLKKVTVTGGSILYGAFYNCTKITTVVLGDNVTGLGKSAFYGCTSLTSVTIGNGITTIGYEAFRNCSALTSVTTGNNVTVINSYAFADCSSLATVTMSNSVTMIGMYAFQNCKKLTSITIPENVTYIGSYAFSGCTSLTSVTFKNTSGWFATQTSSETSGTNLTVTTASTNATYLTSTYKTYYLKRS